MDYMPFVKLLSEASVSWQMPGREIVPGLSKRPDKYLKYECTALEEAFLMAAECPGSVADIWGAMAEVFTAMNAELRAVGAHELMLVDFRTFLALLDAGSEPFYA
ncbi:MULTISPECIES: hypothetical protein [Rhizobium]|jgi:hypothetical protein|uniref:hypothetical protein n=1 Tax=Rhizobium TaxID=379 RepID=UPI001030B7B3|nr:MULTISPECIES: hypothetical protein [Rhizobium]TAY16677.1 hypothetical protein ELH91_07740 [Rhizobium leguminosarum]TAZ29772.1 hypothetical protein ELH73_07835 [Rhizobium leguminosarum]TBC57100.1 hypothetical protein ELH32_08270 [Rhizobium ruizarguesonis]TBZ82645.1 hypothetical protein E0H61_13010 [Rhizobium leguminosarum bv. viciae]TBZ89043.1 hypothetical protein E0H56_23505 [Rhizobium leguminosarum bv. viciae]